MTAPAPIPVAAGEAQRAAADPTTSAWVIANAGSGKTRVLVDRVTRLLLDGVAPDRLLCLTFTKVAAAEMLQRLGQRLGIWTTLADQALVDDLRDLDGKPPGADRLARARRLFARTLDAPGGMRIQTIHAFCESLIGRFPIEAGAPPGFAVADDATTAELLAASRAALLAATAADGLAPALEVLVARLDDERLAGLLDGVVTSRQGLRRLLAAHGGDPAAAEAAIWMALGLPAGATPESVAADFAGKIDQAAVGRAVDALAGGSASDLKQGERLQAWLAAPDRPGSVDELVALFLTQKGERRKALVTKPTAQRRPDVAAFLESLRETVESLVDRLRAAEIGRRSAALLALGAALLARYEAAKAARGLLDYDDLIFRADALLRGVDAEWVRFRLDGGIDHVLIDEAQDTSPEQWRVIEALTGEFFAGEGARGAVARTVFAVGDEKQSIFSFQGADPAGFAARRGTYAKAATAAGSRFAEVPLEFSFRSVPAVLDAVDAVFADDAARAGVAAGPIRHTAIRAGEPGLVELWPLVAAPPAPPPASWDAPVDQATRGEASPATTLAGRIADTIRALVDRGETVGDRTAGVARAIRPGDALVLVRRRDVLFEALVRELKRAGLPVAGADRLVLTGHIAVMDLIAAGRFALLPDDDLTLATVLKGPLVGFDDNDLIALCSGRPGRLWHALRARAGERPAWGEAVARLDGLCRRVASERPFEFYAGLLARDDGRRRMLARLGREAADPIDEFIALALAHERDHPPALERFLDWVERGAVEVKRDMEEAGEEVRVMTVHAAKGLEAPVVFLPDTAAVPDGGKGAALFPAGDEAAPALLWAGARGHDDAATAAARRRAGDARLDEYRRLLYVAATRAADRLYVCGWHGRRLPPDGNWHQLVERAIRARPEAVEIVLPWGETGLRIAPLPLPLAAPTPTPLAKASPPGWATRPAAPEPAAVRPLAPFAAGAEPPVLRPLGDDEGGRFRRGQLIHRLLERLPDLPVDARPKAAARFLAAPRHGLTMAAQAAIAREALAVLDAPGLAALFAPGSLAEVAVVGTVRGRPVNGQVDRLAVTDDEVLIVDYKSNRPPPADPADVAPVYRAQLGLYRELLAAIYPGRRVRCVLVWTDQARLMELPARLLDAAIDEVLGV